MLGFAVDFGAESFALGLDVGLSLGLSFSLFAVAALTFEALGAVFGVGGVAENKTTRQNKIKPRQARDEVSLGGAMLIPNS